MAASPPEVASLGAGSRPRAVAAAYFLHSYTVLLRNRQIGSMPDAAHNLFRINRPLHGGRLFQETLSANASMQRLIALSATTIQRVQECTKDLLTAPAK
ncbi:hypothetical protein EC9_01270 [Rosistilla ulvae]|uniref:Uncharacterized protein n=1 Tax=Rosistilla ulvae TaxID=1930277 RepID=A0A517LTP3_9BACT|nr:hypothetical protein EC9_01270 [Rosistilla ulvae]